MKQQQTTNRLEQQTSPYLRQHAHNPVDWYPWCREAFEKAKEEQKPVFLSIGYSTCHWCHAFAHESFEDEQVAVVLNKHFVPVKVDKEERPDIDSVYMSVCQALTGNGGWPLTVFTTPEQKPFFAGTYYPKKTLLQLLSQINYLWKTQRETLEQSADQIIQTLKTKDLYPEANSGKLLSAALRQFQQNFDPQYGGFGSAPKFPSPHHLLFLMDYHQKTGSKDALFMAEKTLEQLYRGGIFDHIGGGFSRYSTDDQFLVPHFEKMLYDNALLLYAYAKAYELTKKEQYKQAAQKTTGYIQREMTSPQGVFYAAQDADSQGKEGGYYLFDYDELTDLLGDQTGTAFNRYYNITKTGNFEGKNIPNLLFSPVLTNEFESLLPRVYQYRKSRMYLHRDEKIITSWNGLMIAALAKMYQVFHISNFLETAERACHWIQNNMVQNGRLLCSSLNGKKGGKGFLDDYACFLFALINLYYATGKQSYLDQALDLCNQTIALFHDENQGGFTLSGKDNERLILTPKETYDGAVPSGNSMMAYHLAILWSITKDPRLKAILDQQIQFQSGEAAQYPMAHSFFLTALSHLS